GGEARRLRLGSVGRAYRLGRDGPLQEHPISGARFRRDSYPTKTPPRNDGSKALKVRCASSVTPSSTNTGGAGERALAPGATMMSAGPTPSRLVLATWAPPRSPGYTVKSRITPIPTPLNTRT